jgi:hypothetical protein
MLLSIPILSVFLVNPVRISDCRPLDSGHLISSEPTGEFSNISLSLLLHDNESIIEGNLTIDYYNDEDLALTAIPFHLYPARMNYESRHGNIEIFNVIDESEPTTSLDYDVEFDLIWVNLDTPLETGERVQFTIEFLTTLPDGGLDRANSNGTDGELNRMYTFASAYPVPCVYDDDGWNIDPYLQIGDPFYLDMAYYDVQLEVDSEFVVAATGEVIDSIDMGNDTLYHFRPSHPVREFTFVASKYFIVESQMVNGVNVSTFYLPSSANYWDGNSLQQSIQSLELFNETFGPYPYSTLNIAESHGNFGGMEYPCQVYVAHSLITRINQGVTSEYFLEIVNAHEIAHQWWYNLVGVDEVDQGFLDEGLTCWSHNYYGEIYYGDWEFFQLTRLRDSVRTYYYDTGYDNKINQTLHDFDVNSVYYYTAYSKAPLLFQKLRLFVGDNAFIEGLQHFFETYAYENAFLDDFVESMEESIGLDLDWFFEPWFNNDQLPDYVFESAVFDVDTGNLNLTISDANAMIHEFSYSQVVPLRVYSDTSLLYSDDIWVNGTTSMLISLESVPTSVNIMVESFVLLQLESPVTDSIVFTDIDLVSTTSSSTVSSSTTTSTQTSSTTSSNTSPSTGTTPDILMIVIIGGAIAIVIIVVVVYVSKRGG